MSDPLMDEVISFFDTAPDVADSEAVERETREFEAHNELAEQRSTWDRNSENTEQLEIGLCKSQNSEASSSEDSSTEFGEMSLTRERKIAEKRIRKPKSTVRKKSQIKSLSLNASPNSKKRNSYKRLRQVAVSEKRDQSKPRKKQKPAAPDAAADLAESKEPEGAIQSIEQYVHADAAPRNADGEVDPCVEGIIIPCPFDCDEWQAEVIANDCTDSKGNNQNIDEKNETSDVRAGDRAGGRAGGRAGDRAGGVEQNSEFCFLCEFSSENEIATRMVDFAISSFGVLSDKIWAENIKKYYESYIRPTVPGNKLWTVASIAKHFFRDCLNQKIADKIALRVLNNCLYAKQMTMCNKNKTTNEKTVNDNSIKTYCVLTKQRQLLFGKKG